MSEGQSSFTQGPWQSEKDLPHNRMPRVHGGDHSLICEVGNMGTSQDQWEANARLIAAAPEMDEVLAELEQYLDGDEPMLWRVIQVRAKARGEQ